MQIIPEQALTAELIAERHARLLDRIRGVAERGGHDPHRLKIVAVTKTWPVSVCRMAIEAGLRDLGENRVQEAEPKVVELPDASWHLVGHLQSNKARRAVEAFGTIHSVDSLGLLRRLDEIASELERPLRLLLQVNLSGEGAKAGFEPAWFGDQVGRHGELANALRGGGRSEVVGLMTMARLGATGDQARATFRRLRELRNRLQHDAGIELPELSMGMSADAEAAAAEGSTLVRIGTALFGPRGETLVFSGP